MHNHTNVSFKVVTTHSPITMTQIQYPIVNRQEIRDVDK